MNQTLDQAKGTEKTIEARFSFGVGHVELVTERYAAPIDIVRTGNYHHIQLSLMPSSGDGCFPGYWRPHRFERIGDVFMVPAHSSLHARSNCRLQQSVVCRFDPQQVAEWFETDIEWSDRRLAASLNIASGDIRRLLYRTAEELRSPGFAQEAMIESIAAQLGIELSRYFRGVDSNIRTGGLPPWRMRVINDYLANDPGGATLAGLANLCGLSVRHLARSFHASHGLSLCDYIAKHRIDLAHRMLAAGSTVKEVAYATGFSAPTNFATAFRRATGCTPRQYRQQLRQNMAGHKHH